MIEKTIRWQRQYITIMVEPNDEDTIDEIVDLAEDADAADVDEHTCEKIDPDLLKQFGFNDINDFIEAVERWQERDRSEWADRHFIAAFKRAS